MKILIVAATANEIMPLMSHFNLFGSDFVVGDDFDILITGVGMTATAFALGVFLNNDYALVLNLGIAGSFHKKNELGALVEVKTDVFSELGAEDVERFLTIDDLGFGKNTFLSTYQSNLTLPKVKSITVNKVHGNEKSIKNTIACFSPEVESMEGAAVFYACENKKIPCLQVRCISNYVEPRNKLNWNVPLAIENLNKWAIDYLENLK
ncbi:MAG: futalosine hydrolase [Sphingobacteriaceae bacterium]|nr:futalosine hydrolase [Sphingobacteriaceae bacterium]